MARIKYTALVESIRGSIQGTTFQRNAYGYSVKAKPKTVNPNRFMQAERKSSFADQVRKWRALDESERAAWQSYAEAFPLATRLNPDSYLNGFNYFGKWHSIFNQGGNSATLADPGTTQATFSLATPAVHLDGSDLYIETVITSDETDWQCYVFSTNNIPMGQEWIKTTPRFVGSGAPQPGGEVHFGSRFEDVFGSLPSIGQWLGIRLTFIRETNGQIVEIPATQYEIGA